jgi:hypothetical protein
MSCTPCATEQNCANLKLDNSAQTTISFSLNFWIKQVCLKPGSHCDSQLPAIVRQCRAFALGGTNHIEKMGAKSSPPDSVDSDAMQAEEEANNPMEDEEEEERPDLSQIIRSLDTPPPS